MARPAVSKEMQDFEADEDMRTMKRAQEILKSSDRMKRLEAKVKKETESLQSIMGKGLRQKLKR